MDDATRFSYGVGFDLGEKVRDGLRTDGQSADLAAIVRGFEDGLNGRTPEIPREELNRVLRAVHNVLLQRAAAKRYESDPEFKALADRNAALSAEAMKFFAAEKPAQELESGVLYRALASGPADAQPVGDGAAVVSFAIYGADARKIDERKEVTLEPSALLPVAGKALSAMRPGDHWLIAIPPEKAFGLGGEPPEIGPNEVLIVDVSVQRTAPRAAAPGTGDGK
jgi:FKBP-type peptidyl-prolyl cis-trans isomerase